MVILNLVKDFDLYGEEGTTLSTYFTIGVSLALVFFFVLLCLQICLHPRKSVVYLDV
jgi:hypothetical protein